MAVEMTITEALAEINLIKKKVEGKTEFVRGLLYRGSHQVDAFEKEGGASLVLKREEQAIDDLRQRLVSIRSAISKANIENKIVVNNDERTIFDWLTWKREVFNDERARLQVQINELLTLNQKEQSRPEVWKDEKGETQIVRYIRHQSLGDVQKKLEEMTEKYNKLDGQLSLKNATIKVSI